MVSPTLVVVQMNGGSMSPDHHYLCSNVTFNTDARRQPFSSLKASHMLRSKDSLSVPQHARSIYG